MSYCTKNDVNNLFGDISDDISDDMFATAIGNAGAWIDSNLKKNYVPIPDVEVEVVEDTSSVDEPGGEPTDDGVDDSTETETETETTETEETTTTTTTTITETTTTPVYNLINVPSGLQTAAIYYSASDILLSLYHGDELPVQYDVWFNKAQQLLEDYIEAYLREDADPSDLVQHQMVKHSKGLTYNQKRNRRRF